MTTSTKVDRIVNLRSAIETALGEDVLVRPTFYTNPGGLRFKLSAGGSAVEQFLLALQKAELICAEVFGAEEELTACLSIYVGSSRFETRRALRQLRRVGIKIPAGKCIWNESGSDDEAASLVHVAFGVNRESIVKFLWCALGVDLGIQPCPHLSAIRLVSLSLRVLVHPYDDRGMDVVGKNHALLSDVYAKLKKYLLDHDLSAMVATFEGHG